MADKRIIELEERLTLSDGDYFATDNTNGTCKVNAKILLDRFSDDEDAIATKAAKVDLTNISITGSTNNTGSTIASGTYFYKDGTLVKAIAAIANGATLTLNTNYEIVTAGGLNDLNNALSNIGIKEMRFGTCRSTWGEAGWSTNTVNFDTPMADVPTSIVLSLETIEGTGVGLPSTENFVVTAKTKNGFTYRAYQASPVTNYGYYYIAVR